MNAPSNPSATPEQEMKMSYDSFKVLTFDVAKVTESLSKSAQIDFFLLGATCMPKNSHAGHLFELLSARGEWPH